MLAPPLSRVQLVKSTQLLTYQVAAEERQTVVVSE